MIIQLKETYKIVEAEQGMRITDHVGDDYTEYGSWGSARMAINANIDGWYEITEEEDNNNLKKQEEQLKTLTDGE